MPRAPANLSAALRLGEIPLLSAGNSLRRVTRLHINRALVSCPAWASNSPCHYLKAIFHCGRFARAGGATNFNHVKNQSRGHAKKVECSSTFMACPRAFRRTKNAQDRRLQKKLSNVRSPARAKRLQWKIAFEAFFHCSRFARAGGAGFENLLTRA